GKLDPISIVTFNPNPPLKLGGLHNIESQHTHFTSTEASYLEEFPARVEKVKSRMTWAGSSAAQDGVAVVPRLPAMRPLPNRPAAGGAPHLVTTIESTNSELQGTVFARGPAATTPPGLRDGPGEHLKTIRTA
ncbi:MAG TPA: hypothetical protein VGH38_35525, partial [Bryobacteraceae bacterium]